MHEEPTTFSHEAAAIKKVEGPITDENLEDILNGIPDPTPVFGHMKTRRRMADTRLVTRQVITALKADGFSLIELFQAIAVLAELLQVMQPIVKDLVDAIKKAFGKK